MDVTIEQHLNTLHHLCRRYHVAELYLFGSATTDRFQHGSSDLDFLVYFEPLSPYEHLDAYLGLAKELEALFEMPVDLIEEPAVRNPYFREELQETRVKLYAA